MDKLDSRNLEAITERSYIDLGLLKDERITATEILAEHPVALIAEHSRYSLPEISQLLVGPAVICDFCVDGFDESQTYAQQQDNGMILIDHHSDSPEMERNVSSTNLAIDYVNTYGAIPKDWQCIIHHTDCDSVLSSLIMRGILPPDDVYGEAAIDADHTGQANPIADLLQSSQARRDLAFSTEQLRHLVRGEELDDWAFHKLQTRLDNRDKVRRMLEAGEFHKLGPVTYGVLREKMDSAFAPALLPDAALILLFIPMQDNPDKWEAKFRLGLAAPQGISLRKLGINELTKNDGGFGGRWNAGSNRRGGGSSKSPREYADQISQLIQQKLSQDF
jgi:hypothetical protein